MTFVLQFLSFSVERGGASGILAKAGWSRGAVCINDPKSYGVSAELWGNVYFQEQCEFLKIEDFPDGPLAKAQAPNAEGPGLITGQGTRCHSYTS